MNEKMNKAVIQAAEEIFMKMLNIKVENKTPKEKNIDETKYEVNVVISLVGDLNGAITLKCPMKLACGVASKMLDIDIEKNSEDMRDAIGEFMNIIVGAVHRYYSDSKTFNISVPSVIVGEDYLVYTKASKNDKVAIIEFNYNDNEFSIEIYLK